MIPLKFSQLLPAWAIESIDGDSNRLRQQNIQIVMILMSFYYQIELRNSILSMI